jgi:hypothetical protein
VNTSVDISDLKPGDRVRTVEGSIAEVIKVSQDDRWVAVRYLRSENAELVGQEDLCSSEDISGRACEAIDVTAENEGLFCVLLMDHTGSHVWRNVNCQHDEADERIGLCGHDHDPSS